MTVLGNPRTPQEWLFVIFLLSATYIIGLGVCEKYRVWSKTVDYKNEWIGMFNRWGAGIKKIKNKWQVN